MDPSLRSRQPAGFTLVELLVSIVVLTIILLVTTQMIGAVRNTVSRTSNEIAEFREARIAFETLTRRIGQATLNAYDDINPNLPASAGYSRASELRYLSGNAQVLIDSAGTATDDNVKHPGHAAFFQAPLGNTNSGTNPELVQLLNTCGYFVEYGSDQTLRPPFVQAPAVPLNWRYRLMELIEPSENLNIYSYTSGPDPSIIPPTPPQARSWNYQSREWYQNALASTPRPVHPIATNVIALAILPMLAPRAATQPAHGAPDGTSTDISPDYSYDTAPKSQNNTPGALPIATTYPHNQLPPMIRVIMLAVEEQSFGRYQSGRSLSDQANSPSKALGLSGTSSLFSDATYATRLNDLAQVTNALNKLHIGYRVFSTTVTLTPN